MVLSSSPELERLTVALRAGPPLRFAMLFGSVAEGTNGPTSDVDIGIFPQDTELSLQDELSLQTELARSCGRSVDLVRLDRAPTLVRWQVVRHGRVLLEGVPFAAQRFIADSVAEYLDFAPAFERAAETFRRFLVAEGRGRDAGA
jgi:predicted nucleotidyltransferase